MNYTSRQFEVLAENLSEYGWRAVETHNGWVLLGDTMLKKGKYVMAWAVSLKHNQNPNPVMRQQCNTRRELFVSLVVNKNHKRTT